MNNVNIDKLTEHAKWVVNLYNTPGIKFNNTIKITSNGYISDPEPLKHVENIVGIIEELKQNGNIAFYTKSKDCDGNLIIEFQC